MDRLRTAELYAIIADALDTTGDDAGAREAVAAGRSNLAPLTPSPAVRDLQLRLELVYADTAQNESDLTAALQTLNRWEPELQPGGLGHACLLLVRGRIQGRRNQHELAAKDGLMAHELAIKSGSSAAAVEAAYQLGTTFRRAGLHEDALRMEEELITYARAKGQPAALATGLWAKAQILGAMGQPEQGLPVLAEARTLMRDLKDEPGLGFADHELCYELSELKRYDEAERACLDARRSFQANGRQDQLSGTLDLLARIELARNHPRIALAYLEQASADGGRNVPPTYQPRIYRDLSEALGRVGRPAEALAAAQKSMRLSEQTDQQRRSVAVAVLSAERKFAISAQERASLARELVVERDKAASRERTRWLSIGLAVAGVLVSVLVSYLLLLSRRHARELQRHEAILRETSMNAPDALALLDEKGAIRFANRSLFGPGVAPRIGQPLTEGVPAEARQPVSMAVTDLIGKRQMVTLDIELTGAGGVQYFELRGVPIIVGDRLLGATLRVSDVTEIRALEREVLAVASEERQRLSADLHEGVGQELTGVSLLLRSAAKAAERGDPDVLNLLNESMRQVDRTIDATRVLARGLSPVQVDRGSLSNALERLAVDCTRQLQIPTSSTSRPADVQVSDHVSNQLYRIAYEAVHNASHHSGCRQVTIELLQDAMGLRLGVMAEGGRRSEGAMPEGVLGSRMMAYRARLIGGTLNFETCGDGGVRVLVSVPHANRDAASDAHATRRDR